jgi:hypothetical protein
MARTAYIKRSKPNSLMLYQQRTLMQVKDLPTSELCLLYIIFKTEKRFHQETKKPERYN